MTGPSGPDAAPAPGADLAELAALGVERTAARELDDALYYLRTDCVPCAERHFDKARLLGATEETVAAVRAEAAAAVRTVAGDRAAATQSSGAPQQGI